MRYKALEVVEFDSFEISKIHVMISEAENFEKERLKLLNNEENTEDTKQS